MYYSREDQNKAAQTMAESFRTTAAQLPRLKKVLKSFDGKVFNCRLEAALNEPKNPVYIFCRKRYKYLEIYTYVGNHQRTLATCLLDEMPDGKRIPADLLIKSAEDRRADFLKTAAEIERAAEQMDTIKEQIEQVKRLLEGITKPLPYEVIDIYNLNYRLTN